MIKLSINFGKNNKLKKFIRVQWSLLTCVCVILAVSHLVERCYGSETGNPSQQLKQTQAEVSGGVGGGIPPRVYFDTYPTQSYSYPPPPPRPRPMRGLNFFQALTHKMFNKPGPAIARSPRQIPMPYQSQGYRPGPPPPSLYNHQGPYYSPQSQYRPRPRPPGFGRMPMVQQVQSVFSQGMKMVKDAFITMPEVKQKSKKNYKAEGDAQSAGSEAIQTGENKKPLSDQGGSTSAGDYNGPPESGMNQFMGQMMHTMNMTKHFVERHENLITGMGKLMGFGVDMVGFFTGTH